MKFLAYWVSFSGVRSDLISISSDSFIAPQVAIIVYVVITTFIMPYKEQNHNLQNPDAPHGYCHC